MLAALAPTLTEAVRTPSRKAYVFLDGSPLPINCIATARPFHSGKYKKHGVNVQVIADPFGRLLWASPPALPGAVYDVYAAREHGIFGRTLPSRDRLLSGDKGLPGRRRHHTGPYWGRGETLSAGQQAANRPRAKIRALVEQGMATLKTLRFLRKL